MLIRELITEGRDAPLYHATDAMRAANILSANRIDARTWSSREYPQDGQDAWNPVYATGLQGISLSRDRTFAHHWWQMDWPNTGRVVLVLDQAKLARDGARMEPERHPDSKTFGGDQFEEFHVGPIHPLDRYLLAVEMTQDTYRYLNSLDRDDFERKRSMDDPGIRRVRAMLKHPKLRLVPGKDRGRHDPRKAVPRGAPLAEGRDAFLFHGTPLDHLLIILDEDALATGINWRGEGDRVATSRDWRAARSFGEQGDYEGPATLLVLDQRKLAQRHRLRPYRDTDSEGNHSFSDEMEEMVMGNIKPLHRYLVSITIEPGVLESAMNDTDYREWVAEKWAETNPALSTPEAVREEIVKLSGHPLLNRWRPRSGS